MSSIVKAERKRAWEAAKKAKADWDADRAACEADFLRMRSDAADWLPLCRRASPREYNRWLDWFIEHGGHITHCYDYPMPDTFKIVHKGVNYLTVTPLYGSAAVYVIIPPGVSVDTSAGLGHNRIFTYDDMTHDFVPCYR